MAKCFQAGPEQSDELLCFFFAFFKIKLRCRLDHKHVKICTDLKLITTKNTLTSLKVIMSSTGSSARCSMMTWRDGMAGRELGGGSRGSGCVHTHS